jgi:hypothetical protein
MQLPAASSEDAVLGLPRQLQLQLLPEDREDDVFEGHLHRLIAEVVPGLKATDIFNRDAFLVQLTNTNKIYQMTIKHTKWKQNIPNGHKIYQMTTKHPKWKQNIPNDRKTYYVNVSKINLCNDHKMYQMETKYTKWKQNMPNDRKIYQMAIKCTYQHLPLQNPKKLPKLEFWVRKYSIWQPCRQAC